MLEIVPIDTPTLGDRSYLVHDGTVAFVVDPQRDIDRVLDLAAAAGVAITHVFETHIHNDYITGGLALAARTGAAYHVNADDPVTFDRVAVRDDDVVTVGGSMTVQVIATPGHTFTHLSYALREHDEPVAVFSGGALLYGSVGRPDLLGPTHTHDLVHHQYASAHRLAAALPDTAALYPTHGFGSFCSATQSDATASTIGGEKRTNPVLTNEEQAFVEEVLAGLDAWPAYYTHMGPANTAGPAAPDLSTPRHADAEEIRRRLAAGEWVVDLRNRVAFAAGHVAGTLNFGIDGSFATYLGWLIPWGTPLTLLAETPEHVAEAQRELVRIGIDRPAAHATGTPTGWSTGPLATIPRATFADLAQVRHHRPVTVLDTRRNLEAAAARIDGAIHIPLHELRDRLAEVPYGEVWVHCAAGYRASIAASILAAAGRHVVAVDDAFDQAAAAGLPITTSTHEPALSNY
ncbi:MBL fold metallo-hydrolase [Dactylosporangium matsuzakiense]|uniref:MBL fold metallo-hydrolase n=1 Tax=Dactylosporangium matsuzakiense TaxID=53360 RepID=A0A9W6KXK0_9ACTN|nr:MBL fold metallo-hydrolase [Dactylosporangium matsuzakiense]UWZ42276.1 MBL fold metallo-hydrolase [Dactylosporangium matsuzakiense]GLL07299.1 MBL fold metallo-hydrolase [Dactylosporangium matsuzakiense]